MFVRLEISWINFMETIHVSLLSKWTSKKKNHVTVQCSSASTSPYFSAARLKNIRQTICKIVSKFSPPIIVHELDSFISIFNQNLRNRKQDPAEECGEYLEPPKTLLASLYSDFAHPISLQYVSHEKRLDDSYGFLHVIISITCKWVCSYNLNDRYLLIPLINTSSFCILVNARILFNPFLFLLISLLLPRFSQRIQNI